jgi:5-formyltetrahydrofolate cyclo-ligase
MAAPHFSSMTDLDHAKRAARRAALAAREGMAPSLGADLARHLLASVRLPAAAIVAGVWPMPGEIDLRPLMRTLHARGNRIVLPETPPRGHPLLFRQWFPGAPMQAGRFGTVHPTGPQLAPEVVLVPFVAFDQRGMRLGYGGGYYDRTLAELPGVLTIGCGFAAQEVPAVPCGVHDVRLDIIATERGIIDLRSGPPPGNAQADAAGIL